MIKSGLKESEKLYVYIYIWFINKGCLDQSCQFGIVAQVSDVDSMPLVFVIWFYQHYFFSKFNIGIALNK